MKDGTLVQCGDEIGVVISDNFGCCSSDETLVVFDGTDYGQGTDTTSLKEIGRYEATPDPIKCGAGRGEDACIYLTCGAKGFECERFSSMRTTLIFRTMTAKRQPKDRWPACYLEPVAQATATAVGNTGAASAQSELGSSGISRTTDTPKPNPAEGKE